MFIPQQTVYNKQEEYNDPSFILNSGYKQKSCVTNVYVRAVKHYICPQDGESAVACILFFFRWQLSPHAFVLLHDLPNYLISPRSKQANPSQSVCQDANLFGVSSRFFTLIICSIMSYNLFQPINTNLGLFVFHSS